MTTRYYYKDYAKHSSTPKIRYTQAPFIGWIQGGLLNAWYAQFQRQSEIMLIPRYLLTKETKELLPALPQEERQPDIAAMRASIDAYLEQIIIQRGLVQFFQAVSQYTNTHLLGPDDMFVRGTCGHRYITKYVNRADLLAKLGRDCPKCQPQE